MRTSLITLALLMATGANATSYMYKATGNDLSNVVEYSKRGWEFAYSEEGEWVKAGSTYSCENWLPLASEYTTDETFEQSTTCSQDYKKTVTDYEINNKTSEVRIGSSKELEKTEKEIVNRIISGTAPAEVWSFSHTDTSNWAVSRSDYNCSSPSPSPYSFSAGHYFTQNYTCSVDYTRTITNYEQSSKTSELRVASSNTETKTESQGRSKTEIGLSQVIPLHGGINTAGTPCSAIPAAARNWYSNGFYLQKGEEVRTCDNSRLVMQGDGNLVVYNSSNAAVWWTGTVGSGHVMVFQGDGNMVLYNSAGGAIWASGTAGSGSRFWFINGGSTQIANSGGAVIWAK